MIGFPIASNWSYSIMIFPVKIWPKPPSPQRLYTLMRFLEGIPRALKSLGSHDEIRSVIAAFKNRFLAVLPENWNLSGLPRGEASSLAEWYRSGAIVRV